MAQEISVYRCASAKNLALTCNPGSQCASFAGTLYGCCPDGQTVCPMATTCVEFVTKAIPTSGPYGAYCTDPAKPYCATITVEHQGVWRTCASTRLDLTVTQAIDILTMTFGEMSQSSAAAPTRQSLAASTSSRASVAAAATTKTGNANDETTSTSGLMQSGMKTSTLPSAAPTTGLSSAIPSTTSGIPASQSTTTAALGIVDTPPNITPGGIAGIVIGVLAFIIGFALFVWWCNRRYSNSENGDSFPIPGTSLHPGPSQPDMVEDSNMLYASYARPEPAPRSQQATPQPQNFEQSQEFREPRQPQAFQGPRQYQQTQVYQGPPLTQPWQQFQHPRQPWRPPQPPSYRRNGPSMSLPLD